uniref:Ribonuclease H-like domain-containing protein n=1 Tax=Tanacetum cinerariifolium TaxID=118510 RepID=A0A6L2JMH3_TANCI|nr:ribonuclease H-like domain-containing protein [Tanacetum cinerariifolium]
MTNGSTQLEGVDVDETFSLVVKSGTIQTVLSLATSRHWSIHQLDVKNSFLHGDLSETVYMHQSLGIQDHVHPDYLCLLQWPLYGLKQRTNTTYLLLYVDGIVLTASSETLLQDVLISMQEPHFLALKRILRYVRGLLDHGLKLFSSSTTFLVAYSDTNWAGCPTTRRSTSGYCVFLGNNLLS